MADGSRVWRVIAKPGELVLDALREILGHKLRSLLTLFGIVFGAAAVVAMTSLASALKVMAYDELSRMGMPRTVDFEDRGPRSDVTRAEDLRYVGVRTTDVTALGQMGGVRRAYGVTNAGRQLAATTQDQRVVPVAGVDAGYLAFRNWPVVRGRELSQLEVARAARVAVLGELLAEPFFGAADPIGRSILIDGVRFRVIGLVAPVELELVPADFSFLARRIYIPYTYVTRYYRGEQRVDDIVVRVADSADFATTLEAGTALLRRRHRGADDFEINNEAADVAEDLAMADGILTGWNVVLFTIAGVTLFVGGVGLLSVLIISVRERVREIGIRMALGADDRDIRRLFLVESMTLALLGAILGVGGGTGLILVTEMIAQSFGKNFVIPVHVPGAVAAVVFATLVGLLFGWYPASRAAKLNPIEAIREL